MIRSSLWPRSSIKRLFIMAAILIVGAGAWVVSAKLADARDSGNQQSVSTQNDKTDTLKELPTPQATDSSLSADSTSSDNAATTNPTSGTATTDPNADPIISTSTQPKSGASCTKDMADSSNDYQSDVKKEKLQLDKLLSSLITGINISSRYVSDYNAKVLDLFNHYNDDATKNNCAFPVPRPAPLPPSYFPG